MHLANFALHAVAARSARLQDPRMRSLRSVGHLQVRLLQNLADSISRFSKYMRLPGVAPLISCLRCVDAHKLRVDCLCRACTQETGACIGGASASLSGGGAAMCMATCQPSCYTSTGLAQVRPAGLMHLEACAPVSADVSSICLVLVSSAEESRFKSRAYSCVMRCGTAWYIYLPASLKSCALDVCHVLTCMCAWCSGQFAALTGKGVQEGACRAARHAAAAARLVGCLAGGLRARPEALGSAAHALPGLPAAVQEADAPEVALAGGECS